ncbi:MAG TPA: TRAP transporter small permease [Desulfohalobiaceae bacterium]|nr:TRAP transporter small permease [Desulfohalobiaceae bacterium]
MFSKPILDKLIKWLNRALLITASFLLLFMIILTCANIALRVFWVPISGTFELMGLCGALVTAFSLGYTQIKRGHIAVDVLIKAFPQSAQKVIGIINSILCIAFFSLATWKIFFWSTNICVSGEVTETLRIVYYPFSYGVSLGCAFIALVFLVELIRTFSPQSEN